MIQNFFVRYWLFFSVSHNDGLTVEHSPMLYTNYFLLIQILVDLSFSVFFVFFISFPAISIIIISKSKLRNYSFFVFFKSFVGKKSEYFSLSFHWTIKALWLLLKQRKIMFLSSAALVGVVNKSLINFIYHWTIVFQSHLPLPKIYAGRGERNLV